MRERMRPYLHSQGGEHQMRLVTHASSIVSGRILRSSKISSGSNNSIVSSTILAYKNMPRLRVSFLSHIQSFSYLSPCQLVVQEDLLSLAARQGKSHAHCTTLMCAV
jgi:hypothetical protein